MAVGPVAPSGLGPPRRPLHSPPDSHRVTGVDKASADPYPRGRASPDARIARDLTEGRGTDAAIDAVGLEAHGNAGVKFIQKAVGLMPDALARPLMDKAGMDRQQHFTVTTLHAALLHPAPRCPRRRC